MLKISGVYCYINPPSQQKPRFDLIWLYRYASAYPIRVAPMKIMLFSFVVPRWRPRYPMGLRCILSLLTLEYLIGEATGLNYLAMPPQRGRMGGDAGVIFNYPRTRCVLHYRLQLNLPSPRRLFAIVMTTDDPNKNYNRAAWQRRARRAMKYVAMPIVMIPNQPREQLMLALPFPSANKTINFALDTLRRRTLVTPAALKELSISDGQRKGDQPDFGGCVELPAARIGREYGDHFLVAMNAVVGNDEQVRVLGPNTGGVLGLDFLNRYDIDFDFERNEAKLYVAGAVDQGLIETSGLEGLACGVLPGGKLGIKMELNGGGVFTGVLDLASNNTVGNWLAARDLDMTSIAQGQVSSYPRETGRSRPLMCAPFDTVQLGHVLLSSVVNAKTARDGRLAVYIGHLPEFESIARDISNEPRGRQLALVGQDLITHTRMVLSCRSKRLYFAPLEANDVWASQVV